MSKLTDEFKLKIHERIRAIEKISALEIVPVVVARSSDYFAWKIALSTFMAFMALIAQSLILRWGLTYQHILVSAGCGILFWILMDISSFSRFLLPRRIFQESVQEEAALWFLKEEVFRTKDRTGVLIFISEFERCVLILADKGLISKIPETHFATLGQKLAADFQKGSAGETFMAAIESLATEVAPYFPARSQNPNELENQVRTLGRC